MSEDRNESLVCLDEEAFEYIEAAILLHNVGRVIGKKGYHKCSYHIIKVYDAISTTLLYLLCGD